MLSWQRIIYYLGLALVEATPPALLLTLAGGDAWFSLVGVVLAGALVDWIVLRRVLPARQGVVLLIFGLLCALWVVNIEVAGGLGLAGFGQGLGALFSFSHPRAGVAYLSLLAGLYCFWRGARLTLHDSMSLHRLFRNATIGLLLLIALSIFSASQNVQVATLASEEILTFFAVGLVTIALASAIENRDAELRILNWRGMLILCGAVGLVLALGLLLAHVDRWLSGRSRARHYAGGAGGDRGDLCAAADRDD